MDQIRAKIKSMVSKIEMKMTGQMGFGGGIKTENKNLAHNIMRGLEDQAAKFLEELNDIE